MEGRQAILVTSLESTPGLAPLEELDFGKMDSGRTDLLSIGAAINELTQRSVGVDNPHGYSFRTSAITAPCSLTLISSKLCSSLTCISSCRSVTVPRKPCFTSFLRLSHVVHSSGNRFLRPSFIKASSDLSSILSERHITTSSSLKRKSVKMELRSPKRRLQKEADLRSTLIIQ